MPLSSDGRLATETTAPHNVSRCRIWLEPYTTSNSRVTRPVKPTQKPSGPHRGSLLVIFLTVFIDLLGFGIVLPLLPIYGEQFASQHGFTSAQTGWLIGLLMASFSAMQFFFLPMWGRLSDLFGRRPILLIGLLGSTVFYTIFGLATVWRSLVWLFVARIGAGIAGATISTAQAYIADTTTAENRTKGMALIGAAFALGFTLGPVIGAASLLVGTTGDVTPWPGYFAAGLSGMAFLLALWLLPESKTPQDRQRTDPVCRAGRLARLGRAAHCADCAFDRHAAADFVHRGLLTRRVRIDIVARDQVALRRCH